MAKTSTLNLRVNPEVKKNAEKVLSKLGIPMSTAIDMYLNQIVLTGGIPFPLTVPQPPKSINADLMSDDEFHKKLNDGIENALTGNVYNAKEALKEFEEEHFK